MIILFGGSGLIGSHIVQSVNENDSLCSQRIEQIKWAEVAGLSSAQLCSHLLALSETVSDSERIHYLFANGITDPRHSREEILDSNLHFPLNIIRATAEDPRCRYVTIGTIQENFVKLARSNPYLWSKYLLGKEIEHICDEMKLNSRIVHVRLHTVYGNVVKPHMFLGQMITAIREGKKFSMSSGQQLREYHHVEDVSAAFASILAHDWGDARIIEMNSGNPVRLSDLASFVFSRMNLSHLLHVAAIGSPANENTEIVFTRSPQWVLPSSRDPYEGVLSVVKALTS